MPAETSKLILASASPRRGQLLTQAGLAFTTEPADIDETALPGEPAAAYVQRLATEKASAVCARHGGYSGPETLLILAADTAVVLPDDGTVLGKPRDRADAVRMLGLLAGRTHAVLTGVAVIALGGGRPACTLADVEVTQVTFHLLTAAEIEAYVDGGEPMGKAGAYAIQGFAARFIPRIEGDYTNVVGLPLARTVILLAQAAQAQAAGTTLS